MGTAERQSGWGGDGRARRRLAAWGRGRGRRRRRGRGAPGVDEGLDWVGWSVRPLLAPGRKVSKQLLQIWALRLSFPFMQCVPALNYSFRFGL